MVSPDKTLTEHPFLLHKNYSEKHLFTVKNEIASKMPPKKVASSKDRYARAQASADSDKRQVSFPARAKHCDAVEATKHQVISLQTFVP